MNFREKLSFNKNYDFKEEEIKKITLQLDYANNTDFDFSVIANAYDKINIHAPIIVRKFGGGYYDNISTTQDECYIRLQFYSHTHGFSSVYHILLNHNKNTNKYYYKGYSKINKLERNIRNMYY